LTTDVSPPVLQCPSNQNLVADSGKLTVLATWPTITAADNSGTLISSLWCRKWFV